MDEIIIRFAQNSDLEAIRTIWNYYILNTVVNFDYQPKSKEEVSIWFQNKLASNYPVLVAEKNREIVAYASYGQFRNWEGFQYSVEHGIYIKPGLEKSGIGLKLFQKLKTEALNQEKHTMIGAITSDNLASLAFHKKLGFIEIAHFKEIGKKNDKWLDCTFVQLILNKSE